MRGTTHHEIYMDYINNFLTVSRFAEFYEITEEEALELINEAKDFLEGEA